MTMPEVMRTSHPLLPKTIIQGTGGNVAAYITVAVSIRNRCVYLQVVERSSIVIKGWQQAFARGK